MEPHSPPVPPHSARLALGLASPHEHRRDVLAREQTADFGAVSEKHLPQDARVGPTTDFVVFSGLLGLCQALHRDVMASTEPTGYGNSLKSGGVAATRRIRVKKFQRLAETVSGRNSRGCPIGHGRAERGNHIEITGIRHCTLIERGGAVDVPDGHAGKCEVQAPVVPFAGDPIVGCKQFFEDRNGRSMLAHRPVQSIRDRRTRRGRSTGYDRTVRNHAADIFCSKHLKQEECCKHEPTRGTAADGSVVSARAGHYGVNWIARNGTVIHGDTIPYARLPVTTAEMEEDLRASLTLAGDRVVADFGRAHVYIVAFNEFDLAFLERYRMP